MEIGYSSHGGNGEFKSNKNIWVYNIGTYAYTLASTNRFNDILTPKCTSYHKCFEYQKQLTAVLGTTDDLGNPTELNMWNLETKP